MIVDTIANAAKYFGLTAQIDAGLKYLQTTDFTKVEPGKYEIPGTECRAVVMRYDSKPLDAAKWEAHRKFTDIQYIADGLEQIAYADISALHETAEYDPDKDFQALEGEGSFVRMDKGMFMLLFPHDAHMPCVAVGQPAPVFKVVVKVPA